MFFESCRGVDWSASSFTFKCHLTDRRFGGFFWEHGFCVHLPWSCPVSELGAAPLRYWCPVAFICGCRSFYSFCKFQPQTEESKELKILRSPFSGRLAPELAGGCCDCSSACEGRVWLQSMQPVITSSQRAAPAPWGCVAPLVSSCPLFCRCHVHEALLRRLRWVRGAGGAAPFGEMGRSGRKLAKMAKPWCFSLCPRCLGYGLALAARPGRLHEPGQGSPGPVAISASPGCAQGGSNSCGPSPLCACPRGQQHAEDQQQRSVLANGLGSVVAWAISFEGGCFCCWPLPQTWVILRQRMTRQSQLFCSSSVVVGVTAIALS